MPTVDQIRGITTRPAAMTSTTDGRDHLISERAIDTGLAARDGRYPALCGRTIVAAPLVAAPKPTCLDCESALHRHTTTAARAHRRTGMLARLLRRR